MYIRDSLLGVKLEPDLDMFTIVDEIIRKYPV